MMMLPLIVGLPLLFLSIEAVTSPIGNPVVQNASLNQIYTADVNQSNQVQFQFYIKQNDIGKMTSISKVIIIIRIFIGTNALRVYVEGDGAESSSPVFVVVLLEKGVLSWQLPMNVQQLDAADAVEYTAVNRTLCPGQMKNDDDGQEEEHRVIISLSTSSLSSVTVSVSLYIQPNYIIEMNKDYKADLTPSASQYYQFTWPEHVDTAIIHINSEQDFCMTVSVQNISCPVYDLNKDVNFEGFYQTIDTKTGMSIRRDTYPEGLHIVFVEKATDVDCNSIYSLNDFFKNNLVEEKDENCHGPCRDKKVTFYITNQITKDDYLKATFGAFFMFCGAYVIVILVSCILCVKKRIVPTERTLYDRSSPIPNYNTVHDEAVGGGVTTRDDEGIEEHNGIDCASEDSSVDDDDDIDMLTDAEHDKEVFRTKTMLFVSDLARKSPKVLCKRSSLYQWNLITIAIFYGLPVIQLVITYQQVLNQTGNEDLCYYNFLCANPLGLLTDFNHVYSNIGYVMLGGLFMIFVRRREFHYSEEVQENPGIDRKYGIPSHYGLFYAMGLALICEGFMSGCYHICPNHSNFQFDTAFKYTIAILCSLKIYQFRHPDLHASAYSAFGVLAFVIFVGVIGVVNGSLAFWIIFTILYIITALMLSIQLYYMGRWKIDLGLPKRLWLRFYHDILSLLAGDWRALKPMYPERVVLLLLFNIFNWLGAAYGVS